VSLESGPEVGGDEVRYATREGRDVVRDGFFDVAYVDGYHGYDVVVEDIANAFRLCKLGGIICGDDYHCSPEMMAAIPEDALHWDEYIMPAIDIGVHPGVVLALDRLLGAPRSYGGGPYRTTPEWYQRSAQ
jgi:hypothetical protein